MWVCMYGCVCVYEILRKIYKLSSFFGNISLNEIHTPVNTEWLLKRARAPDMPYIEQNEEAKKKHDAKCFQFRKIRKSQWMEESVVDQFLKYFHIHNGTKNIKIELNTFIYMLGYVHSLFYVKWKCRMPKRFSIVRIFSEMYFHSLNSIKYFNYSCILMEYMEKQRKIKFF